MDSEGNTIHFLLRAQRNLQAAERFFRKAFKASHTALPRVINVDGNPAYSSALKALREEGVLPKTCTLCTCKYLNNIMKQDHRTCVALPLKSLRQLEQRIAVGLRSCFKTP